MGLVNVCLQVVSSSNGMSTSYLYDSVKDVLKWSKLDVRMYAKTVMAIGSIYHLSQEDFEEHLNSIEYLDISLEDLQEFYKD